MDLWRSVALHSCVTIILTPRDKPKKQKFKNNCWPFSYDRGLWLLHSFRWIVKFLYGHYTTQLVAEKRIEFVDNGWSQVRSISLLYGKKLWRCSYGHRYIYTSIGLYTHTIYIYEITRWSFGTKFSLALASRRQIMHATSFAKIDGH